MEIHGGAAGTTVIEEGDGTVLRGIFLEVGRVEDARGRGAIFGLGGHVDGGVGQVFAVEPDHRVLRVRGADGKRAGDGAILDGLAADLDRAFGNRVRRSVGGGDDFGFSFCGGIVLRDCERTGNKADGQSGNQATADTMQHRVA